MFETHTTPELEQIAVILMAEIKIRHTLRQRQRDDRKSVGDTNPVAMWDSISWELQLSFVQQEIARRKSLPEFVEPYQTK